MLSTKIFPTARKIKTPDLNDIKEKVLLQNAMWEIIAVFIENEIPHFSFLMLTALKI